MAEWFSKNYVKYWYWDVINVVFNVWQSFNSWVYEKDWYKIYILPAFDIIYNYPVPKFWKRSFWSILLQVSEKQDFKIIQTHTRFFLSTFIWWIFAKIYKRKWVHIEHGSWYVKWISLPKRIVAFVYDFFIWRLSFLFCDKIVVISKANLDFIKKFTKKTPELIYNWVDFDAENYKKGQSEIVRMCFVWRLIKLKWVDILLGSIRSLAQEGYDNFYLKIYWEWDQKPILEEYVKKNNLAKFVEFCWRNKEKVEINILPETDIFINPSLQEWLPTTVVEWLLWKCVVVATDVWWTREISNKDDLIIVKPWDIEDLKKGLIFAIKNYNELVWLSFEDVKGKFGWEKSVGRYGESYERLK